MWVSWALRHLTHRPTFSCCRYGDPAKFIDGISTLNGGIDYDYYHYMRWVLLRNEIGAFPLIDDQRVRVDGAPHLWQHELQTADHWNPLKDREENTMWVSAARRACACCGQLPCPHNAVAPLGSLCDGSTSATTMISGG